MFLTLALGVLFAHSSNYAAIDVPQSVTGRYEAAAYDGLRAFMREARVQRALLA